MKAGSCWDSFFPAPRAPRGSHQCHGAHARNNALFPSSSFASSPSRCRRFATISAPHEMHNSCTMMATRRDTPEVCRGGGRSACFEHRRDGIDARWQARVRVIQLRKLCIAPVAEQRCQPGLLLLQQFLHP